MTHVFEDHFADNVALPYLRDQHPDADIQPQHYVEDPDGFVDVWVDLGTVILAVEIGNDASVRDEAAQAIEYADHDDRAVPVVIVPADHVDQDAAQTWRDRDVVIRELSEADVDGSNPGGDGDDDR